MDNSTKKSLQTAAAKIRLGILEEVFSASSGHPGGSLSIADILSYLFFKEMRIDPKNPEWEDRDRFVLSKGHTAPALYATLANRGYFDVSELKGFRKVHIPAGESVQVDFTITAEELSFYNHELEWVCEAGDFEIMLGPNSRDVQKINLKVIE